MPDFLALARDFDYDLWANTKWLECLLGKGLPEPDTGIFRHILSASEIWLQRVNGASPAAMPEVEPVESELQRLHDEWIDVLSKATDDRPITYRRTTGEELTVNLYATAHHAANHGTYHRGELRGLCLARGDDDFPETDLIGYILQQSTK